MMLGRISIVGLLLISMPMHQSQESGPFRDVSNASEISFKHASGSRGKHDLPEIMGGGLGLIDVDGDGLLDLYFTSQGPLEGSPGRVRPASRLYRNRGDGRFEDITDRAGAPGPTYAMGVAVGDFDNDRRDDFLVTGWGEQHLYRGRGDGTFEDVTLKAGIASDRWTTSAAFADLDGDGDLDLFVATYLSYNLKTAPYCAAPDGKRDYCGPEAFDGQADLLYRNNGDGTFTEIANAAGLGLAKDRGLGVLVADLIGDAKPDIFVANDGSACKLWENLGNLTFREVAIQAGVAFDAQGDALAGMGVAHGDIDGDGKTEIVVTNFLGRSTIGFQRKSDRLYADASSSLGLGPTREGNGFGIVLEDFDGDGRLDLFQTNGHVLDRARIGTPFEMAPIHLKNQAGKLVLGKLPNLEKSLGRGLVVGDMNYDGKPDLVYTSINEQPTLLMNRSEGRFVCLEFAGKPVGTTVVAKVGDKVITRHVVSGGSYLSASSTEIFIGLANHDRIDRLTITWPSGRTDVRLNVLPGRIKMGERTFPQTGD